MKEELRSTVRSAPPVTDFKFLQVIEGRRVMEGEAAPRPLKLTVPAPTLAERLRGLLKRIRP